MTWLLSIECLNTANVAETLYFSDDSYVSDAFEVYPNRLTQPSNLTVSPNDGGVLSIFKSSSVGDIELDNTDRELDFLFPNEVDSSKTYKLDGRTAILKLNGTEYLRATIDSVSQRDGKIVLSLKALSESLVNPIDLDEYSGANDDLNGDGDLQETAIPVVYGYSRSITPLRTSLDKEIYQACSNDDAVIVAVYSNGNRYVNYETTGTNTAGASSIVLKSGVGGIPNGSWLAIKSSGGEINFYQTTASLADDADLLPATVPITPNLINTIATDTPVEIVNSYANTAAMIADSDACVIDTEQTTNTTLTWRSYNGYFRLIYNSQSTVITCDVATRTTGNLNATDKAFDVFEKIIKDEGITKAGGFVIGNSYKIYFVGTTDFTAIGASANTVGVTFTATGTGSGTGKAEGISAFTLNQSLKTTINGYGDLGLFYDTEKPKKQLLDDVIRSIGGCYWFIGSEIQIYLLDEPKATADFIIEEYKILEITRENTGIGENGVPYQGYKVGFDKIETVQDSNLAGILTAAEKTYLKHEYRYVKSINNTTKSKRLLAKLCEFNSLLRNRTQLSGIITGRLRPLTTQRRDVVSFSVKLDQLPAFSIGDTTLLKHRDFDYSAGRLVVIVGYEVDAQQMTVKFLVCG